MPTAVRATDLTKSYRLYTRPIDRFLELLLPVPRHTVFPALQEVSFEIEEGETIGLIGQNGAGKSTLLKLLCGVTTPTSGRLEAHGNIASILELGTGFHPDFTGRDNAALNAAILGLSPGEVKRKLPAILEFSELGRFLDQPVKTYSSGMYMRLAFSVAVNVDPDILVIDEALAVGDGHFQKKCIDKIREFQQRRKTIVFCSHALYYISNLCDRTLWLDQGTLRRIDRSVDVVHEYEAYLLSLESSRREKPEEAAKQGEVVSPVRIADAWIADAAGNPASIFTSGDDLQLRLAIDSDKPAQPIHVMVGFDRAADSQQCFVAGTHYEALPPLSGKSRYEIAIDFEKVPLVRGEYDAVIYVGDENALHVFDRRDLRPAFSVGGDRYHVGMITVPHRWREISRLESAAGSTR